MRCNIDAGVNVGTRRADVSLRDVTIAREEKWVTECERHHAPEACGGFWDFEERELKLDAGRDGRLSGSQRRDEFARYGCRTR